MQMAIRAHQVYVEGEDHISIQETSCTVTVRRCEYTHGEWRRLVALLLARLLGNGQEGDEV